MRRAPTRIEWEWRGMGRTVEGWRDTYTLARLEAHRPATFAIALAATVDGLARELHFITDRWLAQALPEPLPHKDQATMNCGPSNEVGGRR